MQGTFNFGREPADGFVYVRKRCINILAGGIGFNDHIIVGFDGGTFWNVGQKNQSDADRAGSFFFDEIGRAAGGNGAGRNPRLAQFRTQQVGIAAVHHQSTGDDLQHPSTDAAAAIDADGPDLLGFLRERTGSLNLVGGGI